MQTWHLLPTVSAPMPFQLALDEILFRQRENKGGEPILRFYFSSEPWISVGYSMRNGVGAYRRVDDKFAVSPSRHHADTIPICCRITGGGRVLHGRDLIFSLIASKGDDESFSSVRMSYLKIHEAVKCALEKTGAAPRFFRCDEELPRGRDCFRFPMATDLGVGDRKIAGGAQRRSAGILLHQESIQPTSGIDSEDLLAALPEGFEEVFRVTLEPLDLDPALLHEADDLGRQKYEGA